MKRETNRGRLQRSVVGDAFSLLSNQRNQRNQLIEKIGDREKRGLEVGKYTLVNTNIQIETIKEATIGVNRGFVGVTVSAQKTADIKTRLVNVNDRGHVIGQDHPKAVLADAEVDLLLELRGEGYSYGWLAHKFEVSKACVQMICTGRRRGQIVSGSKRIRARAPRG